MARCYLDRCAIVEDPAYNEITVINLVLLPVRFRAALLVT
jgi:hypothetical protein